jgi:signal transduction histidine kinase
MGLSLKILLTLSGILIGFAVTSGVAFNMIQRNEFKRYLLQQGEMMISMLAGSLQQGLYFEDQAAIDRAVQTLLSIKVHENHKAVTVYGTNDAILSRQLPQGTDNHPEFARMAIPMRTALSSFHQHPEQGEVWESDEMIIFTMAVSVVTNQGGKEALFFDTEKKGQGSTVVGYAQLVIVKDQCEKDAKKAVLQTVMLTLIFLIISLVAAYFLTRETLVPLKRLVETLRARGVGQPAEESDEVGVLGDTFSRLLDDLNQSFSTIQNLKDDLEETVTERTQELSLALVDLKMTHMHLAQSEKMVAIGRLVAGVAHEINNTTNFISGALPLLRKKLGELEGLVRGSEGERLDGERCEAIFKTLTMLMGNISEGTRRTNKIVGDLNNFSRPGDDQPRPVDINECLRTTVSLAYPEYKHRIEVKLYLSDELPLVEGVQGQLNQVFMNLLLNATQAIPRQGTIIISTSLVAGQVRILFHDSGPGIPAEVINHIFEPFFTTKEIGKGTGLGLSISYGIIKKHQGTILARSKPGTGCEFEISLPLRRPQEPSIISGDRL